MRMKALTKVQAIALVTLARFGGVFSLCSVDTGVNGRPSRGSATIGGTLRVYPRTIDALVSAGVITHLWGHATTDCGPNGGMIFSSTTCYGITEVGTAKAAELAERFPDFPLDIIIRPRYVVDTNRRKP